MGQLGEDAVFESVRALADAGEYRDQIPGEDAEGPGGHCKRLYDRGSPELVQARQAGLLERLPPLQVAPAEAVGQADVGLGP